LPLGIYYCYSSFAGYHWIFENEGKFQYETWTDLTSWSGDGFYHMIDDTLFIEFSANQHPLAGKFLIDTLKPKSKEEISISVQLNTIQGWPAFPAIAGSSGYGCKVDTSGSSSFSFARPDTNFKLYLRYLMGDNDSIYLESEYDYNVTYHFDEDAKWRIYDVKDTILVSTFTDNLYPRQKVVNPAGDTIAFIHIGDKNFREK
jgi:hypothetical protein